MERAAHEELVARARALGPALRERSEQAERDRRVPEQTIADIVAAKFPRICQPARFGGLELGWDSVCAVSMELGRHCTSQAWVSNVFAEHNCCLALFPDQAQQDVWRANPEALVSSSYGPTGKVEKVAEGVRVTGRYHYSSGVHHAQWSIIGGMVPREGGAYRAMMLIPASDRRIVDNWHTMGMAGTSSCDFDVDGIFIPEHRILEEQLISEGRTPGSKVNKAPVYRMPQRGISQTALASVPIGAAEGAVDDFAEAMKTRVVRGDAWLDSQAMQLRLAESSAEVECAKRLVMGTIREIMDKLATGANLDENDIALVSRNAAYGVVLAQRAVTRLFEAAGGSASFLSNRMQRTFRDIYTAGGHLGIMWDRNATLYSRTRLGLGGKHT
jgi:alkylation response protein AidB-like acyl-CoA dehydrogenase